MTNRKALHAVPVDMQDEQRDGCETATLTGFHSRGGDPANVKICERGTWKVRMVVESVFSLLTRVCHSKQMKHRVWEYFEMRLGFLLAIFNVLLRWRGIQVDENGVFHLSLAEFSL